MVWLSGGGDGAQGVFKRREPSVQFGLDALLQDIRGPRRRRASCSRLSATESRRIPCFLIGVSETTVGTLKGCGSALLSAASDRGANPRWLPGHVQIVRPPRYPSSPGRIQRVVIWHVTREFLLDTRKRSRLRSPASELGPSESLLSNRLSQPPQTSLFRRPFSVTNFTRTFILGLDRDQCIREPLPRRGSEVPVCNI